MTKHKCLRPDVRTVTLEPIVLRTNPFAQHHMQCGAIPITSLQHHKVNTQLLRVPIALSEKQLLDTCHIGAVGDPQQDDRPVTGDAATPQHRRSTNASFKQRCGRSERRGGMQQCCCDAIETLGQVCVDSQANLLISCICRRTGEYVVIRHAIAQRADQSEHVSTRVGQRS
ncbi:hypothetical protein [Dyella terrae]|uniref:hypothetical protein n=1 Tax=Dyella terrae TaxID=522259 RepID=UPI001EFE3CCC|nr:hypothetical protein [Dyella terrae]